LAVSPALLFRCLLVFLTLYSDFLVYSGANHCYIPRAKGDLPILVKYFYATITL
jgi:hypothetical protein